MGEDKKDILDTISAFNLRARYDDYKMEFHKKCSKDFTEERIRFRSFQPYSTGQGLFLWGHNIFLWGVDHFTGIKAFY